MMLFLASLLLGGVTVTLPMEAHVRGTEVELGEIAQVVGADPEDVSRVAALPGRNGVCCDSWGAQPARYRI